MILLDVIFYSFLVVVFFQAIYYGVLFGSFAFIKLDKKPFKNLSVSVLICAKNEADNLKQFLPSIFKQNYSNFEVVLINSARQTSG